MAEPTLDKLMFRVPVEGNHDVPRGSGDALSICERSPHTETLSTD
jgi:hypothetical protein